MRRLTLAALATGVAFAMRVAAADSITNIAPKWTVPTHWREIAPGPAMVKAYSPMPGTTKAVVVTVDRLPSVIHRERPPLDLPRIELTGDRRDSSRSTVPLPDPKDRATMIDLQGRDPDQFAPRRLIVIKGLANRRGMALQTYWRHQGGRLAKRRVHQIRPVNSLPVKQ